MGPFRMSDLAGVDVAKFAGGIMANAYADRNYISTLVDHLFEAKRFGQKTGSGYYKYSGKNAEQDPALAPFVEKARKDAGNPPALDISDQEIVETRDVRRGQRSVSLPGRKDRHPALGYRRRLRDGNGLSGLSRRPDEVG